MRRRTTPIGCPRRDPRHYRFAVPNAVWKCKLKPVEFVIFSYLCYHSAPGVLTLEMIVADVHVTAGTVKKYLTALRSKGIVSEDGTPVLKCKDKKFFTLPNEVFLLRLPPSAFLVYAYLLLIEDRRTHTCHPSYNTIAAAAGMSKNTDDISLAKIISYCTSQGRTAVKLIIKTRQVNTQTLGEFIDINEAYRRISLFASTREFLLLPKENQKDVIAFLVATKRSGEDRLTEGLVAEETIEDELQKMIGTIQRTEV